MRSRKAFTLLEVLVVIALISVLMGLLLPAVQKVREASAALSCRNNLHQLGLALHHYHDAYDHLPVGLTSPQSDSRYPYMTWLTRALPYCDQSNLWDQTVTAYALDRYPFNTPPHDNMSRRVALFGCPSDSRMQSVHLARDQKVVGSTSYLGVLGTDYQNPFGVLTADQPVRLLDITDGCSSTLMIGERPPSPDFWYGWWYAGYGQHGSGSCDMLLGVRELNSGEGSLAQCPKQSFVFQNGNVANSCDLLHYWSLHPGGANFAFCDGSVRFLTYRVATLMPALSTRSGGEVVELD